ncbi:hypothetical protein GXW74_19965 [Roseomonas eburnea]|uniref:Uncharacterized protein n=1 Tax=Neoroseomonas eburnea TaxID=1346889 RepID=A0A9X9XGE3_9PROT|nr:hypothetical protein [Neoroseomonas eburnea]MBR0682779.1 hypothetical protein [Neoroseomonas eburnea]
MSAAAGAGALYAALAFVLGTVLGPVRELVLAPRLGGMAAALAEAAVMAALLWPAAWIAAGRLPRPAGRMARGTTAAVGVALVLLLEAALGLAFEASGLAAGRAPRSMAERAAMLPLLLWMAALPFLVRR